MVDARGHGRSGGDGMDLGWYGDLDTAAAVTFLAARTASYPPGSGSSGCRWAARRPSAPPAWTRIRAVVAEGATGRTAADNDALRPEDWASTLERGLDAYTYGLTDLLTGASAPASLRESVASSEGTAFLLVTAGTVEQEALAAESMRGVAPARVEVWTVPGAGHTQGLATAPAAWEDRVVGFLDEHLLSRSRSPAAEDPRRCVEVQGSGALAGRTSTQVRGSAVRRRARARQSWVLKAASKAALGASKARRRTNSSASGAPTRRSMPASSHSIEMGPS